MPEKNLWGGPRPVTRKNTIFSTAFSTWEKARISEFFSAFSHECHSNMLVSNEFLLYAFIPVKEFAHFKM